MSPSPRSLLSGAALLGVALASAALAEPKSPAPQLELPQEGALAFDVRDAVDDGAIPCKLTLVGVAGSRDGMFTRGDIGRQEGDAIVAHNRVFSASGRGVVHAPVGTYDVYVSRGLEWDIAISRHVEIRPGQQAMVKAKLRHVVETPGWISADFHVHAAPSPDSRVPLEDRVYEFVADGVDMIVSTDHNVVSDYEPIIEELGLGRYLMSATGDELTTGGWGHFGAFPLPADLERAGQGAILVHGRNAADFFADVRKVAPEALIDVHHPRIDTEIGYFNLAHFDARNDRADRKGFSFDFDAIEVLNGYQDAERRSVDRLIDDWFSLINHGHVVTATGNSDTHHLDYNLGGYPRNYVRVLDDAPQRVRPIDVARAVKAHRSFFTTGPFVKLHVNGGEMGATVQAPDGKIHVEIEVDAAPWVSVSRVTLYAGGNEVKRFAVPPSTDPLRFRVGWDLGSSVDTWVVVRVDGDQPLAPIVGDLRRFDVRPLALTNPVFVDVDRDGAFRAPYAHGAHAKVPRSRR